MEARSSGKTSSLRASAIVTRLTEPEPLIESASTSLMSVRAFASFSKLALKNLFRALRFIKKNLMSVYIQEITQMGANKSDANIEINISTADIQLGVANILIALHQ